MEGEIGNPEGNDQSFPPADVDKELNPGLNKSFEVDPVSSQVAASKEIQENKAREQTEAKEQAEAARVKTEQERMDALQTLKSALIVSGIVVAVAGAVFAITKKLKEK